MAIWDSIISAGSSLLGGILGGNRADAAAEKQAQTQREFAQSGIQWKVKDAEAAGIHPLYALGANTVSYSPVTVGDGGIGKGLSDASQDIGRAAKAALTHGDRDSVQSKQVAALQLERAGLENELLRSQIAKERAQIGPAMPALNAGGVIPGQPATLTTAGGYPVKPDDIKQKPDTMPATGIIRPAGVPLKTNKYLSDAQDVEDRYGETVSDWIIGPANLAVDGAGAAYRAFRDYIHRPLRSGRSPYSDRFSSNRSSYKSRFRGRSYF